MPRKRSARSRKTVQFLEESLRQNGKAQSEGPKRKKWSQHDLKTIKPLTPSQEDLFHAFYNYDHMCAYGTAGTGKTYLAFYLSLNEVFSSKSEQDRLVIVRSVVPTRDIGFLPGDLNEKLAAYESPYHDICADLIGRASTYDDMKNAGIIQFMPTSFVRGLTWDNAMVLIDEVQNMSFHEINSVITRLGTNSRVVITGDTKQSDLRASESGMEKMLKVVDDVKGFSKIRFTEHDIVRSDIVKSWIVASEKVK